MVVPFPSDNFSKGGYRHFSGERGFGPAGPSAFLRFTAREFTMKL